MTYTPPTFTNGGPPALSAANLNAMGQGIVGVQYATAATAANTARVTAALNRGVSDVSILVITDSTGNGTDEWPYRLAQLLAAQYPAYTVTARFWNESTGTDYSAATTIQTGTGAKILAFHIVAVSGSTPGYVLGSRWANAIVAASPHLVIIGHGHNMGDPTTWGEYGLGVGMMLALTEEIAAWFPRVGIVLIAENPITTAGRETWSWFKADAWQQLAAIRNYGIVDVFQAFCDYGDWAADLMADGLHPNATGSTLWAETVARAFVTHDDAATFQQVPPLLLTGTNHLANHDFAAWSGTDPDSWTPLDANTVTSKDTTNVETGAHGMKMTAANATGATYVAQSVALAGGPKYLQGQVVTAAVRYYVPASNTATVRLTLFDNVGGSGAAGTTADVDASSRDRYRWLFVTRRVDPAATSVTVRLHPRTTGDVAVEATVDRVYLVRGALPLCG